MDLQLRFAAWRPWPARCEFSQRDEHVNRLLGRLDSVAENPAARCLPDGAQNMWRQALQLRRSVRSGATSITATEQ
jgi:hypothetical protein